MIVGRTPLDAELRRDPRFDLLRPRSATDAIGELAESTEPGDLHGTIVLLSPDAVTPDRSAAFVAAIRRITPEARVLEVNSVDGKLGGVDGVIAPTAGVAGLLAAASRVSGEPSIEIGRSNARPPSAVFDAPPVPNSSHAAGGARTDEAAVAGPLFPEIAPRVEVVTRRPADQSSIHFQTPRHAESSHGSVNPPIDVHERTPLGAILAGRDPVEAGLASIRALRGHSVRFVPSADAEAGLQSVAGMIPVGYSGKVYGYLGVEGGAGQPSWLTQDASWLAGWAALGAQQERLRADAFCDELTGAWNRRYFSRFLASAIAQSREMRRPVSLLVFDIDNFKSFNDRYGHSAGDDILVETVRLLKTIVRPSDRVCRVGGDEFAVIFHDPEGPRNPGSPESMAGLQSVADIARRFQRQLCEHRFPKLADQAPGSCSISGGMATFPWDGQTPEELLERADALALQSKRQGKNAITIGPGAERACEPIG